MKRFLLLLLLLATPARADDSISALSWNSAKGTFQALTRALGWKDVADSDYGSFNTTFTSGPWSVSQTVTASYARTGKVVTLCLPQLSPAANNTSGGTTAATAAAAIPASIYPKFNPRILVVPIFNATTTQTSPGFIQVGTDGSLTIRRDNTSTAWTGTGTQYNGWQDFCVSYTANY